MTFFDPPLRPLDDMKKKRVMQESAPVDYEEKIWGLVGLKEKVEI
jgi:hypothetical protein